MSLCLRPLFAKYALLTTCAALMFSQASQADTQPDANSPHYTIAQVEGLTQTFNAILPGKTFLAFNDRRQVAGVQNIGAAGDGTAVFHAAIWQRGKLLHLGVPQGYRHSYASAINNAGQVIGWAVRKDDKRMGSVRAWMWDKQGFHLLPLLAGMTDSAATAFNDRGQVVGLVFNRNVSPGRLSAQTPTQGFVWQDGKLTDLGKPNAKYTRIVPTVINAHGEIAGQATDVKQGITLAFVWRAGMMHLLNKVTTASDDIGADYVNSLNNRGQILGLGSIGVNMAGDILHPFLWDSGKLSRLQINGTGINDRGDIVGTLADKKEILRAALCVNGKVYDLNTLLPAGSDWQLLSASNIDNKGKIIGNGVYKGKPCVYLLTPVDLVPYTLTYLDALEGYATQANAINDAGDVVGDAHLTPDTQDQLKHACLWHSGKLVDLGEGRAADINNQGQIVGVQNHNAFLYQNGKMQRLMVPRAVSSEALAINEQGQIAGTFRTADQRQHGFLYSQGNFQDLGADTQATALSSRGVVAGIAGPHAMAGTVGQSAGLYRNGKWMALYRPLEHLSDQDTGPMYPTAVNDQGDVLGDYGYQKKIDDVERVGFDSFTSMFLWRKDTERDLKGATRDLLNKIKEGKPYPLVNAKHFCASYWLPDHNGKARNMQRLFNITNYLTIRCVNKQGQAVGYTGFNGYTRAFLLTPTTKT